MGVSVVYDYPVPEGKSGAQVVEGLQKQVETLGAVKTGGFHVDCETYVSMLLNPSNPKSLHVLNLSDAPASCFGILDSGAVLSADSLLLGLVNNLKNFYQARKGAKMEARGQRFTLSDFIIKIGSVSMSGNFKGILLEVEYAPCCVAGDCWPLLRELLACLLGPVTPDAMPPPLRPRAADTYTPTLTALQYLHHFNQFRNKAIAGQPQANTQR